MANPLFMSKTVDEFFLTLLKNLSKIYINIGKMYVIQKKKGKYQYIFYSIKVYFKNLKV